jgi:hypothetical protein
LNGLLENLTRIFIVHHEFNPLRLFCGCCRLISPTSYPVWDVQFVDPVWPIAAESKLPIQ